MLTKDQTAQWLADAHFRLDQGITRIFRVIEPDESSDVRPVKLLEVNPMTPEVGISPVGFGADLDREVFYPSVIIEITPEEFDRLSRRELRLPHGWQLGSELFPQTTATKAAS